MNEAKFSSPESNLRLPCDACLESVSLEDLELIWVEDCALLPKLVSSFFQIHREPCRFATHSHIKEHCLFSESSDSWKEHHDLNNAYRRFEEVTFVNPYDRDRAFYALGALSASWKRGPNDQK